jgi:hypothetical protein
MHAWPLNFRLKFGDASRRGGVIGESGAEKSDSQWMCSTGHSTTRDAKGRFPGLTRQVRFVCEWQARMFPECWDGKSLSSEDHSSHVRYMNGRCPASHPILLPTLKFQVHYNVGPIIQKSGGVESVWFCSLTGDNTGASMHSDFISGWDPEVLADLLRLLQKRSRRSEAGRIFQVPRSFKTTLSHTRIWTSTSQSWVIEDAGALVNEEDNGRLAGWQWMCLKDTLHPALYV